MYILAPPLQIIHISSFAPPLDEKAERNPDWGMESVLIHRGVLFSESELAL